MKTIAVIPARGGSQRIPRKNIRPFLGRPMICWPIAAARAAGIFDRIIVSTEDDEIARISEAAGAEVPFRRSADLADEHTGVAEVIRDSLLRLGPDGGRAERVCLLYATAPMVKSEDLRTGLELLETERADFAISITPFPAPIQRALRVEDGLVRMIDETNLLTRSQDLPPSFHDAGQFCWGRAGAWLNEERVFVAPTAAVEIPAYRVQDIDTEADWLRAEAIALSLGLSAS